MTYRILTKVSDRPNGNSLYKYYKELDADGNGTIWETTLIGDLDKKIEELINVIPRKDIDVVIYGEYDIDAIISKDDFDMDIPTDIVINNDTIQLINQNGDAMGNGTQINVGGYDLDGDNDGIVNLDQI